MAARGADVIVFERRTELADDDCTLGIHPSGLAALDEAGIGDAIRRASTPIRTGVVTSAHGLLTSHSFDGAPIRLVQQDVAEAILEQRLSSLAPAALRRGVRVRALQEHRRHVELLLSSGETCAARYAVGADGVWSLVRESIDAEWREQRCTASYAMADAPASDEPDAARLYLEREGVVESIPLPEGRRS